MVATFMEVLDTSGRQVSLPHIAGNLSATTANQTWVLTSYLCVSERNHTADDRLAGNCSDAESGCPPSPSSSSPRFRLCGMAAEPLVFLIVAVCPPRRGGGALLPISQAVLLGRLPPKSAAWPWRPSPWAWSWRRFSGHLGGCDYGQLLLALDVLHRRPRSVSRRLMADLYRGSAGDT